MNLQHDFNLLVSDILDGNNCNHCRLCLCSIEDEHFANFLDGVACPSTEEYLEIGNILRKIFGEEVCKEIAGLNAICSDCLDKTLDAYSFIQQYEMVTAKLHKAVDNLTAMLSEDLNITGKNQVLYIVCDEDESRLVFVENKESKEVKDVTKVIKCHSCKEHFDVESFIEHNRSQHDLLTCKTCFYTSKNDDDLIEHELSTTNYKCDSCALVLCTEESLRDHENRVHSMQVCKECGKSFKGLDKLQAHELKHFVKNQCPKCGKTYNTKEFFEKHVTLCLQNRVELHPMRSRIQKTHCCQKCGKGYSTPGGLRVHERFVHGNAEHHVCKECGKKFTAPCYLKVHQITHTKEKNFPCDLCQGKFVSKEALLYHRRRHTGEKPYVCDHCGERFVNASARVEHIKFKHIGPTLGCDFCPKKFVTKNILRKHMKKHYDPSNKSYVGRADIPHNVHVDAAIQGQ